MRRVKGERRVNEEWRKRRVEKVRIRYYFYFHNLINFKSFLLISILFCLEFIDSKKRGEGDILTHLSEIIRGPFSIPPYHLYHLIGRGALAGEIRPRRIATVLLPSQSCRSTLIQPSKPVTLPPSQLEKCWRIFSVCD